MPTAPSFSPVNHDDESINRVQDHVQKVLDPLVASPLNGAALVKNVVLKIGVNVIPHPLARRPQGWAVARQHLSAAPIDWTNVPLNAPWVAKGSGFDTPQYRLRADGMVELRGAAQSGTTATNIGSVPASLAPSALKAFTVPGIGAGPTEGYSRLNVNTNGTFGLAVLAGGGTCSFVCLDGLAWASALVPADIVADNLDPQTEDSTKVIRLTSSAAAVVDLLFF